MINEGSINLTRPSQMFGLCFAAKFLPYGVRSMMDFAWLSEDWRAKKVGSCWLFSDKASQDIRYERVDCFNVTRP